MMDLLSGIRVDKNRYIFIINADLREVFPEDFWYEYSEPFENLPEWVLQIPLLANVAPVVWLMGLKVQISQCEKTFWDSLLDLKKVFKQLYPQFSWDGEIACKDIFVASDPYKKNKQTGLLFSGGLDSVTTLIRHHKENPLLLCVNGADVALDDLARWRSLRENTINVAFRFGLKPIFVTSNFRTFLNRNLLKETIKEVSEKDWWTGFQHGWGLSGFLVPLLWDSNGAIGYIASSDAWEDLSLIGSRPDIDECLKWRGGQIIHDGTEYRRHEKVNYLCNQEKLGVWVPELKVCLRSFAAGENCCMCEKCARTIATVLTVGNNSPKSFGFSEYEKMGKDWLPVFKRNVEKGRFLFDSDWDVIQRDIKNLDWYRSKGLIDYQLEFIEWMRTVDFDALREARNVKKSSRIPTPKWLKKMGGWIKLPKPLFMRVIWNRLKDRYF